MLKGISPVLSPDILSALYRMGHGDEVVIGDAHFPAETYGGHVVLRADGVSADKLLEAVLPLFELDSYVEFPVAMMAAVPGDTLDPDVERAYRAVFAKCGIRDVKIERIERFAFYERARGAFLIVQSGDVRPYANVILKKGVTPAAV